MMQSCASATSSAAAGPFYKGIKSRVGIGTPPSRIVWAQPRGPRCLASYPGLAKSA